MDTAVVSNEEQVVSVVGTPVEARARLELGRWTSDFAIAAVLADGYRLRRWSDGDIMREFFPSADVLLASPIPASWPFAESLGIRPPAHRRGAPGSPESRIEI